MIFKDQLNHTIELTTVPKRIISVVPSQTELLFELGLDEEVIGITKFCVHPNKWKLGKTKIGGTKNLNIKKIEALQPDLIIANKEENNAEQIKFLQQKFSVWTSNISTLDESLAMVKSIGELFGKTKNATTLCSAILCEFETYKPKFNKQYSVLYLIWKTPYMSIGNDTIIHYLLNYCGFKNVLSNKKRYPEISETEIAMLQPEFIFLSSEPYPFKEKHINELHEISPTSKIILVDGEMFSWYGSRLKLAPSYFLRLHKLLNLS
ncbi:MAG: helical backbone metal receptor [Vicingaceae bacterium]|nr:helical backbone metal receptor [Vicingaceae bacterium]